MKMSRRILSLVLAAALLITCGITGLVLPVSAANVGSEASRTSAIKQGDFENATTTYWTQDTINKIVSEDPDDSASNKYVKLEATSTADVMAQVMNTKEALYNNLANRTTYKLSFDYKHSGAGNLQVSYYGSGIKAAVHSAVADGVAAEVTNKTIYNYYFTWKNIASTDDEWKRVEIVFTLLARGTSTQSRFSFIQQAGVGTTCIDNVEMTPVDVAAAVSDDLTNHVTYNGRIELKAGDADTWETAKGIVEPGTVLTAKVTPKSGYMMVPGSLKYTTAAGDVTILNKAESGFGEGAGDQFSFEMPDAVVTSITADYVEAAEGDYLMDSIGTSVHYNKNGEADGIRFLTRLNVAGEFDAEADTLTLGGKEVKEIGTLLKRGEVTTLTLEDMTTAPATGEGKMWKAVNYDASKYMVDDYTGSYLDFATVMMTTVADRKFTAVGYITFTDGETVYSNSVKVGSIASAEARM